VSKKKPETWFFGPGEAEFYTALRGRRVGVMLKNGQMLDEILIGADAYHIVLRRRDGVTVLVAKHAILYVLAREFETSEEGNS